MTENSLTDADSTRQAWATNITRRWQESVDAILDVGRLLGDAKQALAHGQWLKMFEGQEMPFGEDSAQRLMKVAKDKRLTNTAHGRYLPNSWRTLYELTKLDDEAWTMAIESGAIHPEMDRKEACFLVNEFRRDSLLGSAAAFTQPSDLTCSVDDLNVLIQRGLKFGTIYADPPWQYGNQGTRASTGNHYEGMSIPEISALPIAELAAENAHLHLWTTNAFLFDCKAIMESWGFCVGVGTRILTDDLRWVKAESLSVGDGILAFDESRQDETGRRYYKFGKVLSTGIEKLPCYLITLENGTELISSDAHAWLMRTSHTGRESSMRWIRTENMGKHLSHHARRIPLEMPIIAPVVDVDRSYEAGFLSAAFDSEGSIDKNKPRLSFVQKDNALLNTVQGYLKEKGYSIVTRDYDYRSTSNVELNGGTKETLRFMMSCRPPRLIEKFRATNLKHSLYCLENVPVKSVRFIGDYPVVTLMTDTGTYIAEGFGSHNTYKSCLVWVKPQMGIGNYWRVSHEFMLLGVRGQCPYMDRSQMSWVQEPRTKHSAKPETIRKMIESVSPGPYLELFGRRITQGWVVWGNQIERSLFDMDIEVLQ